jgi:Kef-type K+ transport system membrane component KefB
MLNFVGFLIIISVSYIGIKSGYDPNHLFNAGLLILMAYILSLLAGFFKLPRVLGYLFAGIIAGYNGLGLVTGTFIENMYFIESLFFMVLISSVARHMSIIQSPKHFLRYFLSGAAASVGTFVLTLGFFAPLSISIEIRIIMGLFCATFSPLVMHALTEKNDTYTSFIQFSFGGYFFAMLLWSFFAVFNGSPGHAGLRLAFMPVVITISSIIAGIVWGFLSEKMLYNSVPHLRSIFPLAVVFLAYPFIGIFGLDFIFIAFGIGIYNGVFSEREETILETSNISTLMIFTLFGMHLSLEDAFLLGESNWKLVAVLVSFFIFSRLISTRITMHFLTREKINLSSMIYFIPGGPMTLILLRIFLPGFDIPQTGDITTQSLYSILMVSLMITYSIFIVLHLLFKPAQNITPDIPE